MEFRTNGIIIGVLNWANYKLFVGTFMVRLSHYDLAVSAIIRTPLFLSSDRIVGDLMFEAEWRKESSNCRFGGYATNYAPD